MVAGGGGLGDREKTNYTKCTQRRQNHHHHRRGRVCGALDTCVCVSVCMDMDM